jgi:hypothetical protein
LISHKTDEVNSLENSADARTILTSCANWSSSGSA